jgi:NPCBM/NEW2 domain
LNLLDIDRDGRLYYDTDGRRQGIALEDISRIAPRTQPTASALNTSDYRRLFYLAGGGRLSGALMDNTNGKERSVRADVGLPQPLDIPFEALAAVRLSPHEGTDAQRQLDARLAERPVDKDLLLVAQGDKSLVLPGALERLTPREWEFALGRKTQKASLDAAYAVVLGGPNVKNARPPAVVRFLPDNELWGRIVSADGRELAVDAGLLGRVGVPWPLVQSIQLRSNRLVYLSDLSPTTQQTRSSLDLDFPPRADRSVSGRPFSIRGRAFEKGLGVHAYASATYKLDGQFDRFLATIGIDDSAAPYGSVVFRVIADGRRVYESKTVRGDEPGIPISVDVSGAALLTLECDDAGDLDISDHADWADAALLRSGASTIR